MVKSSCLHLYYSCAIEYSAVYGNFSVYCQQSGQIYCSGQYWRRIFIKMFVLGFVVVDLTIHRNLQILIYIIIAGLLLLLHGSIPTDKQSKSGFEVDKKIADKHNQNCESKTRTLVTRSSSCDLPFIARTKRGCCRLMNFSVVTQTKHPPTTTLFYFIVGTRSVGECQKLNKCKV